MSCLLCDADDRCLKYGPEALTDKELLSVVLRTGDVDEIFENDLSSIMSEPKAYFRSKKGIGTKRAEQITCIAELSKRLWKKQKGTPVYNSPSSVANYYMQEMRSEKEELRIIFLNTRLRFIDDEILSTGTVNNAVFSVREIMMAALKHGAVNIILLHNHPSGDPTPSKEDIEATKQVKEAGKLIGINLSDHIIIGDNTYYSFKEWYAI